MLKVTDAKLAFFESEVEFYPGIFTIVSNKRNIKVTTMLHGIAGYCFPDKGHSNTVVNYYIVPGVYYAKYLKTYSPHVDEFCPVGNHEIEDLNNGDKALKNSGFPDEINDKLKGLRVNNYKIICVLASYYWPFFPEQQGGWPIFYEDDLEKAFSSYWMPFFEWAGKQKNIFLIFKGKVQAGQYKHPFLRKVLSMLPKEIYYQNDHVSMKEAITASDCIIDSPWRFSSATFTSWTLGKPVLNYDIIGFGDKEDHRKQLIASNADELIGCLKYALKSKLPEELYDVIKKDHHVTDDLGDRVSLRIKRLMAEMIGSESDA